MSEDAAVDGYRAVPALPDRVGLEHSVLERWCADDVFGRLREQTSAGEPFSFFDGPITADKALSEPTSITTPLSRTELHAPHDEPAGR
jgi:hypothetical protein